MSKKDRFDRKLQIMKSRISELKKENADLKKSKMEARAKKTIAENPDLFIVDGKSEGSGEA